jgi:quinol monooxygenase YgiN
MGFELDWKESGRFSNMSNERLVVVAIATAKPGQEAELKSRLEGVAKASWSEPGVVTYAVHDMVEASNQFMMVEVYASDAAFQSHLETDHVKALIADLPLLVLGDLIVYQGRASSFSNGAKSAL